MINSTRYISSSMRSLKIKNGSSLKTYHINTSSNRLGESILIGTDAKKNQTRNSSSSSSSTASASICSSFPFKRSISNSLASIKRSSNFDQNNLQLDSQKIKQQERTYRIKEDVQVLSRSVELSFESFGNDESNGKGKNLPLIILHGFFGSKQNWRSISKKFAEVLKTQVFILDLRNHGESPSRSSEKSLYIDYANDIQSFIENQGFKKVNIIGHSMGGKVAMTLSILNHLNNKFSKTNDEDGSFRAIKKTQEIISKLIVVDISPSQIKLSKNFEDYAKGMKIINSVKPKSRIEADKILAEFESDPNIRSFLLTNLVTDPKDKKLQIRLPLEIIESQMKRNQISTFPFKVNDSSIKQKQQQEEEEDDDDDDDEENGIYNLDEDELRGFDQEVLFIRGTRSDYIDKSRIKDIKNLFKKSNIIDIESGHWVQAERPIEVINAVSNFINQS